MRHALLLLGSLALVAGCGGEMAGGGTDDVSATARRVTISVPDGVFAGTTIATVSPAGYYMVYMACYQAGTLVGGQFTGLDANGQAILYLGPSVRWTGGDAECEAEAGSFRNGNWHAVASTTFHVDG